MSPFRKQMLCFSQNKWLVGEKATIKTNALVVTKLETVLLMSRYLKIWVTILKQPLIPPQSSKLHTTPGFPGGLLNIEDPLRLQGPEFVYFMNLCLPVWVETEIAKLLKSEMWGEMSRIVSHAEKSLLIAGVFSLAFDLWLYLLHIFKIFICLFQVFVAAYKLLVVACGI